MTSKTMKRMYYITSDFIAGALSFFLFNVIRYNTLPYNYESMSIETYFSMPIIIIGMFAFPTMMVVLFAISGFYNRIYFKSRLDVLVNTFSVVFLGTILIFFIALFNDNIEDRMRNYEMVATLWLIWGIFTLIPRLIITNITSRQISSRQIKFDTLIIGITPKAQALAESLEKKYPKMGFNIVGFVDAQHPNSFNKKVGNRPVLPIESIKDYVTGQNIKRLVLVHEYDDINRTVDMVNSLMPLGLPIFITPDVLHYISSRPKTRLISGEILIDVTSTDIPAGTLNLKRIFDVIFSSLALIMLSPVFSVIALLVKRSSPGAILYKQQRLGKNKKPFNIWKFRSMYTDSESEGPALASDDDPRITPVGKILRKYRLDELPQFYNVLKGEMSLVGPRPEREFFVKQILEKMPNFSLIHQVRPGITSWGMVKYGYASSVDEMVERAKFDLLYVDNVSLVVDLKIMFYTIETIITGKGV